MAAGAESTPVLLLRGVEDASDQILAAPDVKTPPERPECSELTRPTKGDVMEVAVLG